MDTGRLYMESDGRLAMQTIEHFPGVIGAITSYNMIALKHLPVEELQDVDFLGRSSIMLAALYRNFKALAYLLTNLVSIDWDQVGVTICVGLYASVAHISLCFDCDTALCVAVSVSCKAILAVQRECVYGENVLHIIARYRHAMNMAYDKVMALLPSQSVSMHALNTLDFAGVPPLTTAINHANDIIFHWLLRNGADVHGNINRTEIRPPNLPIVSALNSDETIFLRCLLELGASPPAHMLWLDVRTQEHFRLLVLYGKSSRDLSLTFSANRIWPVMGSLYPPLITTYNEGVMHRRQLVTTILGTRTQPKLATDLIHLICKYADLLPLQQPQT